RRRRCRAAGRTTAPSRACQALGLPPRSVVVGIRRRAFDPDVAAVEELAFPDRRNLFHALDGVAASRVGVAAMWRARCNRDAGFADLQAADAVVQREPRARPAL